MANTTVKITAVDQGLSRTERQVDCHSICQSTRFVLINYPSCSQHKTEKAKFINSLADPCDAFLSRMYIVESYNRGVMSNQRGTALIGVV